MPNKTTKHNPPATTNANANDQQQTKELLPDSWHTCTIVDIDPEYHAQTSSETFRVFKIKIKGSLKHNKRTFNYYIAEALETPKDKRQDGGSTRSDIIERFKLDPWNDDELDKFMDLDVRAHIGITKRDDGTEYNRVISIYPMDYVFPNRGNGGSVGSRSSEEIPF